MNRFQKIFESTLHKNIDNKAIVGKAISRKYKELGINLEKNQIAEIIDKIEITKEGGSFEFEIDEDKVFGSHFIQQGGTKDEIKVEINEADFKDALDKILSSLNKIYPKIIEDAAAGIYKNLRRKFSSELKVRAAEQQAFEKSLERLWKKPFGLLEMFIAIAFEMGQEFNNHFGEAAQNKNDFVYEVLIRLFARACQIASEVLVLLKSGYADGAYARWRTLHEIAVVAIFIDKHGKDTAERYLLHEAVESYKGAVQHQEFCKINNNVPLTDEEIDEMKVEYENVVNRFGPDFKSEYGWAAAALGIKKPTFRDVEKYIDLDKWRPDYKLASHNVHANPLGLSIKLGMPQGANLLLAGTSHVGLDEPGENTVMSLLKVVTTLLLTQTNVDALVYCQVLMNLERETRDEFINARNRIEGKFPELKEK